MDEDMEGAAGPSRIFGMPLVVALCGCLLLVLAAAIVPMLLPRVALPQLAMIGAAAGFALWIPVLLVSLRHIQWIVVAGALLLLPLAGALAAMGADRIYVARAASDAKTFAEMKLADDGTPILPSGASGNGPVSVAYDLAQREAKADRDAYGQALGRLNPGVLNSPYLLQQAPKILDDCAAIDSLEREAKGMSDRQRERIVRLIATIEGSELSPAVKQGVRAIVEADAPDDMLAAEIETIRGTRAQCDLLARRSWHNAAGLFGFSGGDRAAFMALGERRIAGAVQVKRAQDAAKERRLAGREQVRAELSR